VSRAGRVAALRLSGGTAGRSREHPRIRLPCACLRPGLPGEARCRFRGAQRGQRPIAPHPGRDRGQHPVGDRGTRGQAAGERLRPPDGVASRPAPAFLLRSPPARGESRPFAHRCGWSSEWTRHWSVVAAAERSRKRGAVGGWLARVARVRGQLRDRLGSWRWFSSGLEELPHLRQDPLGIIRHGHRHSGPRAFGQSQAKDGTKGETALWPQVAQRRRTAASTSQDNVAGPVDNSKKREAPEDSGWLSRDSDLSDPLSSGRRHTGSNTSKKRAALPPGARARARLTRRPHSPPHLGMPGVPPRRAPMTTAPSTALRYESAVDVAIA
jgi:hypothetical protein